MVHRPAELPLPDFATRAAIAEVHLRDRPLAEDVDYRIIARATEGQSGADIAGLCRQAAMLAIREAVAAGATVVFASHEAGRASGLAHRTVTMAGGQARWPAAGTGGGPGPSAPGSPSPHDSALTAAGGPYVA